jgi:hypothetical protein
MTGRHTIDQDRASRGWQWASRALFALAIALLVGHFLIYVHFAVSVMRFPFDYDQGEGFELVDTIMFSDGEWPYRDNESYPFYASNYPPLFHAILVPFAWLFGPAYWYGRLAGFVATLVTAAAIGWIVLREGRHRPLAIMAGLAYLASNYIYHVGPLFRQHISMVMFETLAILVLAHVTEGEDVRRRRWTMVAGLLLLLAAGYTKQLALATCIAVFIFLFVRNPRRSIAWGVVFAGAAGLLFLWINVATGGEWWANIIAANVNEYFLQQFIDLFEQWFRLHYALVIPAGLFALYELYFDRLSLYSVWWALALANTALSGKWGAGDSYFATAIAATCVLAGIFAARTVRGDWQFPDNYLARALARPRAFAARHRRALLHGAGVIVPAVYVLYAASVVKMPTEGRFFGALSDALGLESSYGDRYAFYDSAGWVPGYATIGHVPTQTDINNGWRLVDVIRASERPVMSEEAGFSLQADRDVITNPTQLKNLYENDLFDPANLVAAIRAHEFGAIIFRAQFYPPPALDAAYEAYYPDETIPMNGFNYEVWRPGPPAAERDALAAGLESLGAGATATLHVSLPVEQAARWAAHALAFRNWDGPGLAPQGECFAGQAGQAGSRLVAEVCPSGERATIVLRGE